jgi:SRSO17 transposase
MPSSLMATLGSSINATAFGALSKGCSCRPSDINRSTFLGNTAPVVGAQHRHAQALQWVLWESTWSERAVEARRLQLVLCDPLTAPTAEGVLAIDEHGDRKDGDHTAHVGRQDLSNLGKIDHGVVKVEQPVGRCAPLLSG